MWRLSPERIVVPVVQIHQVECLVLRERAILDNLPTKFTQYYLKFLCGIASLE